MATPPAAAFLAAALSLSLSLAGPYDMYGPKLEEAEAAVEAGSHADAFSSFHDAYESLPAKDRAGDLGADVVARVGEVARSEAFTASPDAAALAEAIALTRRHLEDLERFAPQRDREKATQQLAELEAMKGGEEPAVVPTPAADPVHTTPPPATEAARATGVSGRGRRADQPHSKRPTGIALVVLGTGGVLAGVGLLGYGGWRFSLTTQTYEAEGDSVDDGDEAAELNAWRRREYLKSGLALGFGGLIAGTGIGMLIAGAVMVSRNKKSTTAWLPVIGPNSVGLSGKF